MDIGLIFTVCGSVAAIGALAWAVIGNPSLPAWLRSRQGSRRLPTKPKNPKPKLVDVGLHQIQSAASEFVRQNVATYDVVVSVDPDGMVLGSLIAPRLRAKRLVLNKQYTESIRAPYFVFDGESHARSIRPSTTELSTPTQIVQPQRVLIVDGVTTFGNGLIKAEQAVQDRFPDARVDFYVYAIDEPRIAAAHGELLNRLRFHVRIDNRQTWLHFPWDVTN